ncbi:MAG TPA: DJ-1/PfpI family protein [Opitutaceae bacterium]|nr:DJ-1/PfpI family protein [Opitutaceae bacterium]
MRNKPLTVAAVVFPGFELLDLFGPLELLGMLGERATLAVVAEETGTVMSSQGPATVAEGALSQVRRPGLLLVPGGLGTRQQINNANFLELLREAAAEAEYVASVCTGSMLLARAGLLDGRRATSNKRAFDAVVTQGPHVQWVREARWVQDGNYFTSSGVSAGMDMTLALIQKVYGRKTALEIAHRAEYSWREDSTVDPFATPAPVRT